MHEAKTMSNLEQREYKRIQYCKCVFMTKVLALLVIYFHEASLDSLSYISSAELTNTVKLIGTNYVKN